MTTHSHFSTREMHGILQNKHTPATGFGASFLVGRAEQGDRRDRGRQRRTCTSAISKALCKRAGWGSCNAMGRWVPCCSQPELRAACCRKSLDLWRA